MSKNGKQKVIGIPPRKITVIIPHFSCIDLLYEAIRSIAAQTFRDVFIVVIDDCSEGDEFSRLARSMARLDCAMFLRTSRNVGNYQIKNALLPLIASPFIAFQDADDYSLPTRLALQLQQAEKAKLDIVGCSFLEEFSDGRTARVVRMVRRANFWVRLGRRFVCLHPTMLVRRRVFQLIGGFDGGTRFGADSDFILRSSLFFKIGNVSQVCYRKRTHPESLTQSKDTGFGSAARHAYCEGVENRHQQRLRARTPGERLQLAQAIPNVDAFSLSVIE